MLDKHVLYKCSFSSILRDPLMFHSHDSLSTKTHDTYWIITYGESAKKTGDDSLQCLEGSGRNKRWIIVWNQKDLPLRENRQIPGMGQQNGSSASQEDGARRTKMIVTWKTEKYVSTLMWTQPGEKPSWAGNSFWQEGGQDIRRFLCSVKWCTLELVCWSKDADNSKPAHLLRASMLLLPGGSSQAYEKRVLSSHFSSHLTGAHDTIHYLHHWTAALAEELRPELSSRAEWCMLGSCGLQNRLETPQACAATWLEQRGTKEEEKRTWRIAFEVPF